MVKADYIVGSIEQLEQLDKSVVCVVTPEKNAEYEFSRLSKHFAIVINIKELREIVSLVNFIPIAHNDWNWNAYCPFGRYDSPYISQNSKEYEIYKNSVETRPLGIDFREEKQVELLNELKSYYESFYSDVKNKKGMRYRADNTYFEGCDAALLYSIFRIYRPKTYIEIGSGHSTAVALDTNEWYFDKKVKIVSIEPYPDRLLSILKDPNEVVLIKKCVQEVNLNIFETLSEGDIVFIDSSHTAKMGGDIPYEYFEILPRLRKGVIIHIHDIFYPFTYPERWIKDGRCYNETFIVRALLMNNKDYEILFFNDMMTKLHYKEYNKISDYLGGGSIWLRKN